MVIINLLPWRERLLDYQKKTLKKMLLVSVLFAAMVLFCAHLVLSGQANNLEMRLAAMRQELEQSADWRQSQMAAGKPDEKKILSAMQLYREATEKIFVELGKLNTNSVCFTDIVRDKNAILFTGKARSAQDLTEFMRGWNLAALFSEIKIEQFRPLKNHLLEFRFSAREKNSFPDT